MSVGPATSSSMDKAGALSHEDMLARHAENLLYNKGVSAPFRSYVLISREQIARNFRNVRSVVGPNVEVAGVVKADAYGHGALEVARVLCAEGAQWLAVSSVDEGLQLRSGRIPHARLLVLRP